MPARPTRIDRAVVGEYGSVASRLRALVQALALKVGSRNRLRGLWFRGSSPPAVPVPPAVLEPTVNALGALQPVLRYQQPMRPESPEGVLDLGDAGLATTVSRQPLRGQP